MSVLDPATPAGASVVVALLGEVSTRRDGQLTPLPGVRARSLLAALAAHPGRSRSAQGLIDEIWGDQPPRAPMNALHTQVSRLRAALPEGALEIGPAGYRLALDKQQVDLTLARTLEQRAQQLHAEGRHRESVVAVEQAKALWRGEPGADLGPGPLGEELSSAAATRRAALDMVEIAARIADGDFEGALPATRTRADSDPLDEKAHLDLMQVLNGLGRSAEALEVFAAVRSRLSDELGADPGPELVALNTAILRGQATPAPRATVRVPAPIGLRAAPNELLGRAEDLAAIDLLLGRHRVVTVLGPGGTGKTRVANEIGGRWSTRRHVVLVELASVRAADQILNAISSTLGLSEIDVQPGGLALARVRDLRERLHEALSARPILLILDNCEHLIDGVAAEVAELVGACDRLTVLATSRAPMMITAEAVYPLPPLEVDESGSPAIELFRSRATAVRPSARLDDTEIARLCHTLDGLPLAIELAAARVRTMSVEEINARLDRRFALLRSGDRSSPQRHRTLHAVIEWSWNLLDEPQQLTLGRLCRFPAGFTLAAAEAVAEWDGVDDVATALDGLVNQSLLGVVEDDCTGVRYQMLETVREFGDEQLERSDTGRAVVDRMSLWARNFSISAAGRFRTDDQVASVHEVGAEHDNLIAVLRYGVDRGDALTVYTVFPVLGFLWTIRGVHSEVFSWAARILAIDPRGPREREISADLLVAGYLLAGLHLVMAGDMRPLAMTRTRVRRLLRSRTDIEESTRFGAELVCSPADGRRVPRLLADAIASTDEFTRANALTVRANLRENLGDPHGSRRDALRVIEIADRRKDVWALSSVCQHLGSLYGQAGDYDRSIAYYRRSIDQLLLLQAAEEALQTRSFLSVSLVGAGRLDEAQRELDAVIDAGPGGGGGSPTGEGGQRMAAALGGYAELELARGNVDAAFGHFREALDVLGWPSVGPVPGPYESMLTSAVIGAYVLNGRAAEATDIAEQLVTVALDRLGRYRDRPQLGCVGLVLGSFFVATGRDVAIGLELLALAPKVRARQDYPSMLLEPHLAVARTLVGDAAVDEALEAKTSLARGLAVERILELLTDLDSRLPTNR